MACGLVHFPDVSRVDKQHFFLWPWVRCLWLAADAMPRGSVGFTFLSLRAAILPEEGSLAFWRGRVGRLSTGGGRAPEELCLAFQSRLNIRICFVYLIRVEPNWS